MTARQSDWQSFVVPRREAKVRRPSEAALDRPAARQHDGPVPSRMECHHREVRTIAAASLGIAA